MDCPILSCLKDIIEKVFHEQIAQWLYQTCQTVDFEVVLD